jgi:MFS transporter, SET family, sugar efflux transporter
LKETKADVGLIFSVCAFLEVLVMFTFVIRPSKAGSRRWISFGFLAFMFYFLVAAWSPSVTVLLGAQGLRAVGIGLIGYQGISYIQALMPNQVGIAAALFSNTTNAGFLLSGLTAGAWAQSFGYRSMFIACAVLSGLGLLLLYFQPAVAERCCGTGCAPGSTKGSAVASRSFADRPDIQRSVD